MLAAVSPTPSVGPRSSRPTHNKIIRPHKSSQCRDGARNCPYSGEIRLEHAHRGLLDAEYATHPVDRYAHAYLAALRAASAVLATRAQPGRRSRPTSVWTLLTRLTPALAEWSAYFASASATRSAAEAGARHLVTQRDADDMVRQAGQFVALVQRSVMGTLR